MSLRTLPEGHWPSGLPLRDLAGLSPSRFVRVELGSLPWLTFRTLMARAIRPPPPGGGPLFGTFCEKPKKGLASARQLCYNIFRAWKGASKYGALAQLVERTTACASPAPTPQVGELAQKINTKFGALAQLVARYIRIVEVTGSNPVCSTPKKSFLTRVRELFSFSRSTQKLGMRMYRFLLEY